MVLMRNSRVLSQIVRIAVGFGIAAVVALHLARTDLDPTWHVLSEYSIGPYGWLMRASFLCLAIASVGTFAALAPMRLSGMPKIGRWLLISGSLGALMGGIFDIDRRPPAFSSTAV